MQSNVKYRHSREDDDYGYGYYSKSQVNQLVYARDGAMEEETTGNETPISSL